MSRTRSGRTFSLEERIMKSTTPMNLLSAERRAQSIGFTFLLLTAMTHAGPRTSTSYSILTDTTDAGGKRATSASYTHDGSAGGIVGISTVAAPAETAKYGYIGQLTEVTALQLAATPTTVNETSMRQLSGAQLLDDLTTNAVPAASITWSIVSGPLSSISTGGLATAGTVYQDTTATAQGIYAGNTGTLGLTVLNSIPDNFGSYAGDGIGDDWQFQYFGLNNPNASPNVDADFDGLKNLLEFGFGLNPTLASLLQLPQAQISGGHFITSFSQPVGVTGITYGAEWSATLSNNPADWTAIPDTGTPPQHTFSVPIGSNTGLFVRLKVTSP
jgi:hypothetical protein